MKRSNNTWTFAIAALSAVALSIAPAASAADKGCFNGTLQGTFAFIGTGVIVSPPVVAGPTALVNTLTFDGMGSVTSAIGSTSQNGTISPLTEKGTYTVNSDCTGIYEALLSPAGFTAHYFFVIDANVNELQIICTDTGVVFSGTAKRQFPADDWRR